MKLFKLGLLITSFIGGIPGQSIAATKIIEAAGVFQDVGELQSEVDLNRCEFRIKIPDIINSKGSYLSLSEIDVARDNDGSTFAYNLSGPISETLINRLYLSGLLESNGGDRVREARIHGYQEATFQSQVFLNRPTSRTSPNTRLVFKYLNTDGDMLTLDFIRVLNSGYSLQLKCSESVEVQVLEPGDMDPSDNEPTNNDLDKIYPKTLSNLEAETR